MIDWVSERPRCRRYVKGRTNKRHRDHMAEPSLPAMVEMDYCARTPPERLIISIGATAGGLLAINGDFDCRIFDVNIQSRNSHAVVALVLKPGCLFALTTGYSNLSLRNHFSGEKRLTNPYSTSELEKHFQSLTDQVELTSNTGPGSTL